MLISLQFCHLGDGTCQYRAFAAWHFGDQRQWGGVQTKILQEFKTRPEAYKSTPILDDKNRSMIIFEEFVKKLEDNPHEWGIDITLLAMCNAFEVYILVISLESPTPFIHKIGPTYRVVTKLPCYILCLHAQHYEIALHISTHVLLHT